MLEYLSEQSLEFVMRKTERIIGRLHPPYAFSKYRTELRIPSNCSDGYSPLKYSYEAHPESKERLRIMATADPPTIMIL